MAIKRSTGLVNKLNGIKTNLLLNSAFSSDATSWSTTGSSGTLSSVASGQAGNCLQIANAGNASGDAYQDITTVVGRVYKLSVYFKKGTGTAGGSVEIGTTGAPTSLVNGPALTDASWTQYTYAFVATATTTRITLRNESTTSAETALFDTVVCDECLDGFIEIMRNCKCNIYSSPQAATADAAATGTLLATVTNNETATGLTFEESANGVVVKATSETWKGNIDVTGTAAWARFYQDGDDPTQISTVMARFDCTVGTSGTDIIVGSTTCTQNLKFEITGFSYTAPKA
jgi:hypothetical protein